jgi:excisionase family DNA binding protein
MLDVDWPPVYTCSVEYWRYSLDSHIRRRITVTDQCDSLTDNTVVKKTYSVTEVAAMLGIGKNKAYELCNSEQFRIIKVGRSLKVVKQSFDRWLSGGCQ